jgi:hypothetical protein
MALEQRFPYICNCVCISDRVTVQVNMTMYLLRVFYLGFRLVRKGLDNLPGFTGWFVELRCDTEA